MTSTTSQARSLVPRLLAAACVLSGLSTATVLAAPARTYPGANGQIVFSSGRAGTGYYNVYVSNPDGSGVYRVTDGAANDTRPKFSPNASRIAFMRQAPGSSSFYDLFVVLPDGSGAVQLTSGAPAYGVYEWSPDGTRIVYEDTEYGLWVVNIDGSSRVKIASPTSREILYSAPTWSPDGTRLAYARAQFPPDFAGWGHSDLYVVNANGSNPIALTSSAEGVFAISPIWSPDGSRLAYDRETLVGSELIGSVGIIGANGANPILLTPPGTTEELPIAWSASTDRILFSQDDNVTGGAFFTMRPDGTDRVKAFDGSIYNSNASFSPDGTRILFHVNGLTLSSVALDGSAPFVITNSASLDSYWGTNAAPTRATDHLRITLSGAKSYTLDGWLDTGDIDYVYEWRLRRERISGTGTMRSATGNTVTITFDLAYSFRFNTPSAWSGSIAIVERRDYDGAVLFETTVDMASATIDAGAGTGSKSWTTWTQICGFMGCFYIPIWNALTFALDDRI